MTDRYSPHAILSRQRAARRVDLGRFLAIGLTTALAVVLAAITAG